MVVVNRRVGETVIVDKQVLVTHLGLNEEGETMLAFDVPSDVPVDTLENYFAEINLNKEN